MAADKVKFPQMEFDIIKGHDAFYLKCCTEN